MRLEKHCHTADPIWARRCRLDLIIPRGAYLAGGPDGFEFSALEILLPAVADADKNKTC